MAGRKMMLTSLGLLLALAGALVMPWAGSAQSGSGVVGLWQRCSGDGWLVILEGGQQVDFAGENVEAGTYAFDGGNLTIQVQWVYSPQQGLLRESPRQVLTLNPQTGELTSGAAVGGVPQCYSKIPFSN